MKTTIYAIISAIFLFGCEEQRMEKDNDELKKLWEEITALAESEDCINSSNWRYTAVGSKACGGPTGYIAYSVNIDTSYFLELVQNYTQQQKTYNEKYGVVSDCSVPAEPDTVVCENGKPEFVY